jgi:hypothetical protein
MKQRKEEKSFDYRGQVLNKKGQVVTYQPYRMVIEKGVRKIERPPGSGNFYDAAGNLLTKGK